MSMDFYSTISHNKKMTYLLFLFFFLLLGVIAYVLSFIIDLYFGGGFYYIFTIFGVLIIASSLFSYYNSDKIITKVSGAKPASKTQYKQLHNIIEELCIASGLPKPGVFVINDSSINAFATGRNPDKAIVCITEGALNRLNREQVQGVLAHELSHIQNYDVRTMTLATVLVGIIVLIGDIIMRSFIFNSFRGNSRDNGGLVVIMIVAVVLFSVVTPIVAKMISFSISRKREFLADASAVKITRNPAGLASALKVIKNDSQILKSANKATAHLYISNPLKNQKLLMKNLFSTHPPLDDRINALIGKGN